MIVLILAGGSGTRLWPISRDRYPKQFVKLFNQDTSLFQQTFLRSLKLTDIDNVYIITNKNYSHLVSGEIEELGFTINQNNIINEPVGKNTLPAILAGIQLNINDESSYVVFPSDHLIEKSDEFVEIIKNSLELSNSKIITFGILPTEPNTGYGYIQPGEECLNGNIVDSFKEKPNLELAKDYISKGYLWNAGIFMFNSRLFLSEVNKYQNDIYKAFISTNNIVDAFYLIEKGISIDYGILEKSHNIATVPVDIGWNDLGSFDSFYNVNEVDVEGNIKNDTTVTINSRNNLLLTDKDRLLATIGLEDMIVVDTKDALLICKKDQSQDVKKVIDELKNRHDIRTEFHIQDYRPWGHYTVLEEEKNEFKIKRIFIQPGKKLSYQYHHHRSEHWIVVRGIATVTIDGVISEIKAGNSIYIKLEQKHRLANNTNDILEIVEVQLGNYLEEDDIIRLDDDFGR